MSRSVAFRFRTETWFLWSRSLINDPAGNSSACIPGRLALQIIRLVVHDNRFTHEGIRPLERQPIDHAFKSRHALLVGFNISEVTSMMIGIGRSPMLGSHRVEVSPGRSEIRRGAITLFMNVKSMLARRQPGDICRDPHSFCLFAKSDSPSHIFPGSRSQNSHSSGS